MTKPNYEAVVVMTIDGKIAKNDNHHVDWSSREDKKFLHQRINKADVIIVGKKTFEVAKKALTKKKFATRNYIVLTRSVPTTKRLNKQTLLLNPAGVDIKKIISDSKYKQICILGGTQTYSLMLQKGLIDNLFVTIEPLVFGNGQSIFNLLKKDYYFTFKSVKKLNTSGTVLLHYQRV